jgi:hypothetical protein
MPQEFTLEADRDELAAGRAIIPAADELDTARFSEQQVPYCSYPIHTATFLPLSQSVTRSGDPQQIPGISL